MISKENTNARQPASIIAIGAGNRMRTYMHYVERNPDKVRLVAIVEPDLVRLHQMADKFQIPEERRFTDYRLFFEHPVPADAVIICTPENAHFEPTMLALDHGYHVLLEKPIAHTLEQCEAIAQKAEEKGLIVGICHVLRFHPCYIKIKELIESGKLGRVMTIDHTEGVGIDRNAHSYVRGPMNRQEESNPMILAKCCHDVDILLWISDTHCQRLNSFGSLRWFRKENAPEGSALRCIDCKIERQCPYSAVELYWRRRQWISNYDIPDGMTIDDVLKQELREGPHGRCVYHCDNDVVDNQILSMLMTDGTLINLNMDVFTTFDNRTTKINLTEAEIICNERTVRVKSFLNGHEEIYNFSHEVDMPYHGGADLRIVEQFLKAIQGDPRQLPTLIQDSIESHRICFEAERSRLSGQSICLR